MSTTASLPSCRRMVLLTQDASTPFVAKTAICLLRYRGDDVVAVLDDEHAGKTTEQLFGVGGDTPVVASLAESQSPDSLVVGIAPPGGKIPQNWWRLFHEAVASGLDVVSGLHDFLHRNQQLADAAAERGVQLIDLRHNDEHETSDCIEFPKGCLRIHTVGHDCSVGKMVTSVELQRGLTARGCDAGLAATGQTGILIAGGGVPIDCVVADFVNGAAERLVQTMQHHDYLVVEGQGCIVHPRYSAVTLGLLHGSAPQCLVMCYEVTREHVKGLEHVPLRPLAELIRLNETIASVRHPCKVIGVAMNSRLVSDTEASDERERVRQQLGLPVCDVLRHGPDELVDAAIRFRKELEL
jgi:D-glutamate N-acetyltransferase